MKTDDIALESACIREIRVQKLNGHSTRLPDDSLNAHQTRYISGQLVRFTARLAARLYYGRSGLAQHLVIDFC